MVALRECGRQRSTPNRRNAPRPCSMCSHDTGDQYAFRRRDRSTSTSVASSGTGRQHRRVVRDFGPLRACKPRGPSARARSPSRVRPAHSSDAPPRIADLPRGAARRLRGAERYRRLLSRGVDQLLKALAVLRHIDHVRVVPMWAHRLLQIPASSRGSARRTDDHPEGFSLSTIRGRPQRKRSK